MLRNRIVGNDFLYSNVELRWKFYRGIIKKQNVYLALNAFVDGGMVTKDYQLDYSNVPQSELSRINTESEAWHSTYGAGFAIVLNHNFIVSVNYGRTFSKKDGVSGLYIGLNFLF